MMMFLALAIGASAPAATPITIRYNDLNLATPAGERALRQRLSAMERELCTVPADTGTIINQIDAKCRTEFRAQVGAQAEAAIIAARGQAVAAR